MVAPLLPIALAAAAALALSQSSSQVAPMAPDKIDVSSLPLGTKTAITSGSTDPAYYYQNSLIAYQTGDEPSARAFLSVCNYFLNVRGDAQEPYPPTQEGAFRVNSRKMANAASMPGTTYQGGNYPPGILPSANPIPMPGMGDLPDSTKSVLAQTDNPEALYQASYTTYAMGDQPSAAAFLAKCNLLRMRDGKPPMAYPPTQYGFQQL